MVTRAFYARADLDLLLSSPASARKSLRGADHGDRAFHDGAGRPARRAVHQRARLFRRAALARRLRRRRGDGASPPRRSAMALTVGLFRTLGPRRTRLVAQIVAAVVGAVFVIGVQALAILSTNTLSRFAALQSELLKRIAPGRRRACSGGRRAPSWATCPRFSACSVVERRAARPQRSCVFSGRFARHATAAAGISATSIRQRQRADAFRPTTPASMLRRKEWTLLRRDPWLVSQTLMQVLYLLPPALLLWREFRRPAATRWSCSCRSSSWRRGSSPAGSPGSPCRARTRPTSSPPRRSPTATSCEQSSRPSSARSRWCSRRSSLVLALSSLYYALVASVGILIAAASATLIQLWFRTQAKRSQFRRRQTSSRVATFAEAFSSISWAATAGLAASGTGLRSCPRLLAFGLLAGARALRPR